MRAYPRLGAFSLGCFLLVGSSCLAATIQPGQGTLLINQGQGFQTINGPVEANVGDSLMVSPGGMAMAVYPDGCKVAIQPGEVTTITRPSPCTNPFGQDTQAPTFAQNAPPTDYGLALGAVGTALGAAGLGVGIYALTKNNSGTTTTVNTGGTCGGPANPCYYAVSP
jgi:hypothetical protein